MIRTITTTYLSMMLLSFCLFSNVHAAEGDLWIDVNVASYHAGGNGYCYKNDCHDFNQFNYGLGVSYEMDSLIEWTGGFYRNSYDENSVYGGVRFNHNFNVGQFNVTPGIFVGGVTGYDDTEVEASPLQLIALPMVGVSYKQVRGMFGVAPVGLVSPDSSVKAVFSFQLGYRF